MAFSGGLFPKEDWEDLRNRTNELNNTHGSGCSECPYLVKRWTKFRKGKISHVVINNFRECNCRCSYCNAWDNEFIKSNKQNYSLLYTLQNMHDNQQLSNRCKFSWGGGEPTITKDFTEVFNFIKNNNYSQIINSNCIKYKDVISSASGGGCVTIRASIDSGTRETFNKIKGVDCFDNVILNIEKYANAPKTKIELKYIVKNDNCSISDMDGFVDLCKKLKIFNIVVSPEASDAWGGKISDEAICSTIYLIKMLDKNNINLNVLRELYGERYYSRISAGVGNLMLIHFKHRINHLLKRDYL